MQYGILMEITVIRWRLVIQAGVDGFTCCVVYVKCANNNYATTVLDAFLEGVFEYGRHDCIRSDHGGENVEVWRYAIYIPIVCLDREVYT